MKKIILITGASQGLGKVIYQILSSNIEFKVYGTSRTPGDSQLLELDITKAESVTKCVSQLIDMEDRIDVLINNVGSNLIGSLEGTSAEEFQHEMETNFFGAVKMIAEVMPHFRQTNSGHIINISSLGGSVALPYNSTYSSSKAALEAMSESLSYELRGSGIHVSVVSPLGLKIENESPNLQYVKSEKSWNVHSFEMYNKMKAVVKPSVTKTIVAKRIDYIISRKNPKLKYYVGMGSRFIVLLHDVLPFKLFKQIIKKTV